YSFFFFFFSSRRRHTRFSRDWSSDVCSSDLWCRRKYPLKGLFFASLLQTFAGMTFLYLKAVHIVFVVTWFAGLFYFPRLLIYITESHLKAEPEKSILLKHFHPMARRLWYGITWPSAVVTLGVGTAMLVNQPDWLQQGFMHVKLTLVLLLYGYHLSLQYVLNRLEKGVVKFSSPQLRVWNE